MTPPPTDESNIGIVYGLICVALAAFPWIFFDWLLKRNHHEYITTEVREALQGAGWWGVLVCAVFGAAVGVILYHFTYQRSI